MGSWNSRGLKPQSGLGVARSQVGRAGRERPGAWCLAHPSGTQVDGRVPPGSCTQKGAPGPEMTMSDGGPLWLLRTYLHVCFPLTVVSPVPPRGSPVPNHVGERFPLNAEPLEGRNCVLFTSVTAVTNAC